MDAKASYYPIKEVHTACLPNDDLINLQLQRITVCYWPVVSPHLYSPDKFPGFIFSAPLGNKSMHIYGFPVFEYPGLIKVKKKVPLFAIFFVRTKTNSTHSVLTLAFGTARKPYQIEFLFTHVHTVWHGLCGTKFLRELIFAD